MSDPLNTLAALVQEYRNTPAAARGSETLSPEGNHLLHMDNLAAMAMIAPASLDFVYIDPPFASNATYHQRIDLPGHSIVREAYTDVWPDGLSSYLRFLFPRLAAIKPLLKPTGSLCVHLDNHSSHYIKLALDSIFGSELLINEVIWRYGKMSNTSKRFPQNHDTLLIYGASPQWYFQPQYTLPSEYRARFERDLTGNKLLYGTVKHRRDKLIHRRISARERELGRDLQDDDVLFDFDSERKAQDDVFTDISIIKGNAREGLGYATQKPKQLLQRLISAYCPPEGTVADFFCGSGTTGDAAGSLGRSWILTDIGNPAIQTARLRLPDHAFHRDPALAPTHFDIAPDGSIVDFRINDLNLPTADTDVVRRLLASDPDSLIAGIAGGTTIDKFGREARHI